MLRPEEIQALIEQAQTPQSTQLEGLEKLARKYPFCPIFPMLLLQGVAKENPLQLDEFLANYAYFIPDRNRLHFLLHNEVSPPVVLQPIKEEILDVISEDQKKEEEADIHREAISVETIEEAENSAETIIEEEADIEPIEAEELHTLEEDHQQIQPKKVAELDELEKEILASAVSNTIYLEVDASVESEEIDLTAKYRNRIKEAEEKVTFTEDMPEVNAPSQEDKKIEAENKAFTPQNVVPIKKSFLDWLADHQEEKQTDSPAEENNDTTTETEKSGAHSAIIPEEEQLNSEKTRQQKP